MPRTVFPPGERSQPEVPALIRDLGRLATRSHYHCDDPWYSCPKAPDGCADERRGNTCTCQADTHNEQVEKILSQLLAGLSTEPSTPQEFHTCGWIASPGQFISCDDVIVGPFYCPQCGEPLPRDSTGPTKIIPRRRVPGWKGFFKRMPIDIEAFRRAAGLPPDSPLPPEIVPDQRRIKRGRRYADVR